MYACLKANEALHPFLLMSVILYTSIFFNIISMHVVIVENHNYVHLDMAKLL